MPNLSALLKYIPTSWERCKVLSLLRSSSNKYRLIQQGKERQFSELMLFNEQEIERNLTNYLGNFGIVPLFSQQDKSCPITVILPSGAYLPVDF